MAQESKAQKVVRIAELQGTRVNVTSDNRLQVEFVIDDLLKKIMPGGLGPVANCGGCHGCSGCSM